MSEVHAFALGLEVCLRFTFLLGIRGLSEVHVFVFGINGLQETWFVSLDMSFTKGAVCVCFVIRGLLEARFVVLFWLKRFITGVIPEFVLE